MPSTGRVVAYGLTGIPAAIGVAFVARYAYATSDTHDAGLAAAALYGMTAAAAFAGPATAIAVGNAGRKVAAALLGILTVLAIVANWTNTLGAIAQGGAGQEAQSAKASADQADARAELARITAERSAMVFVAATKEAVEAARAAVAAAERIRVAECEERRNRCRERETQEQAKRDALAAILQAKAATDRAAQLDADAAAIRTRLANAPATPRTNAHGEALGRFLSISAASAATAQQALISAIVELVIAATLALPELLRPVARRKEPTPEVETAAATTQETKPPIAPAAEFGSVRRFMLECITRTKGAKIMRGAIYKRYLRWCDEQSPRAAPLPIPAFWKQFEPLCDRVKIKLSERAGKVWCVGVKLAA
jgi:hypothetical protein